MTIAADMRAFLASTRKELRIMRRYPTLLLSVLFWPILLPAAAVLMGRAYSGSNDPQALQAFAERSGTSEVTGFIFVGYAMYMWLSAMLWGPGSALRTEQIRGSLEAVFLTPSSRLVPLFAPPVAALPAIVLDFAVIFPAMWLLFGVVLPLDAMLRAIVVAAIGIPALYAIGALFASLVLRYGEIGPVVHLTRGVFVLACGITFPIAMLPAWAQVGAALLPPTYTVADTRAVLLRGEGLGVVAGDLVFVVALTVIIAALAALVFRWLDRSARRTGMLGRY
ncbi:MAG TPA: ABC transporter permease [Candidatus Limnocylindria bacterium]|nr:ABC transporter permease [Candidatus Limnocylindria bacterium]